VSPLRRPVGGRLPGDGAKLARWLFDAMHEQARVQGDGDEEIGQRAGGHDGDAAPDVLAREFARNSLSGKPLTSCARLSSISHSRPAATRKWPIPSDPAKPARIHHFPHADRKAQHLHAAPRATR
jgi:hypothetical protein